MQVEPLISRIRTSGLNIFQQLKVSQYSLPDELSSEDLQVKYSTDRLVNLRSSFSWIYFYIKKINWMYY